MWRMVRPYTRSVQRCIAVTVDRSDSYSRVNSDFLAAIPTSAFSEGKPTLVTTAIIFIPAAHIAAYAGQCLDYCAARGYQVAGIVHGDWAAAAGMLMGRAAGVMVVARPDHLDPDREPRVEVVDKDGTPPAGPPRNAGPAARRKHRPNQI